MSKQRARLALDDLDNNDSSQVDISSLLNNTQNLPRSFDNNLVEKVAEKSGFVSRQPRKRRRLESPYQYQCNLKTREGIKEIFQEIGMRKQIFDHSTFEKAVLALLEKEGMDDLISQFKRITNL